MGNLNVENLWGTWHLEHFEQTDPNGCIIKSHPSSKGILIYTPSGTMSVSMCRVPDTKDPNVQQNFVRDIYYAGNFQIKGDIVFHVVQVALLERHNNQTLPRRARLEEEGRQLVLEALDAESKTIGKIVWRR